jgi:hypothetical protein
MKLAKYFIHMSVLTFLLMLTMAKTSFSQDYTAYSDLWSDAVEGADVDTVTIYGYAMADVSLLSAVYAAHVDTQLYCPSGICASGQSSSWPTVEHVVPYPINVEDAPEGDFFASTTHDVGCSITPNPYSPFYTRSARKKLRKFTQSYVYRGINEFGEHHYTASCIGSCTTPLYHKYYSNYRGDVLTCKGSIVFGVCLGRCRTGTNPNECR